MNTEIIDPVIKYLTLLSMLMIDFLDPSNIYSGKLMSSMDKYKKNKSLLLTTKSIPSKLSSNNITNSKWLLPLLRKQENAITNKLKKISAIFINQLPEFISIRGLS
jgi:hypothetical protein